MTLPLRFLTYVGYYVEVTEIKTVWRDVALNDTAAAIIKRRLMGRASRYVFCNPLGKRIPQLTDALFSEIWLNESYRSG